MHSEGGAFKMRGDTGEICEKSGEYECELHSDVVYSFDKGDTFTPCGEYDHGTTWIWIGPKN